MKAIELEKLPRKTLIKIIQMYSQNFLTLDGLWFLGVEEKFGQEAAVELDRKMWEKFAPVEARRIKETMNLTQGGLEALYQALTLMTSAWVYGLPDAEEAPGKLILHYRHCPPQDARRRQGLAEFPCKDVGAAIFEKYIQVIDPRIKVKCLVCPPDPHPQDLWCSWEFTLQE